MAQNSETENTNFVQAPIIEKPSVISASQTSAGTTSNNEEDFKDKIIRELTSKKEELDNIPDETQRKTEKERWIKSLFSSFKNRLGDVEKILAKIIKQNLNLDNEDRKNQKLIHETLLKILGLITSSSEDIEQINEYKGIDSTAIYVFKHILEYGGGTEESSPFLYSFVDKVIHKEYKIQFSVDPNKPTDFEKDFTSRLGLNSTTAALLRRSIRQALENGEVKAEDISIGGVLEIKDILQRLEIVDSGNNSQKKSQDENIISTKNPLTEEEFKNRRRILFILEQSFPNERWRYEDIYNYLNYGESAWLKYEKGGYEYRDPIDINKKIIPKRGSADEFRAEVLNDIKSAIALGADDPNGLKEGDIQALKKIIDHQKAVLVFQEGLTENGAIIREILQNEFLEGNVFKMLFEIENGKYVWKRKRDSRGNPIKDKKGKVVEESEGAQEFINRVHDVIGLLYKKLDENPGQEYSKLYRELLEGHAQLQISNIISSLANLDNEYMDEKTREEFKQFINGRAMFEIRVEDNFRQLLHVLPELLASEGRAKEWRQILDRFHLSEIALFTADPLIELVMSEYPTFIQQVELNHGNMSPSDLYAGNFNSNPNLPEQKRTFGYKYRGEFKQHMRRLLIEKGRTDLLQNIKDYPDRLDRAISIGSGLKLLDGGVGSVMANGKTLQGWQDQPLAALMEVMNPEMLFQQGRGGKIYIRNAEFYVMHYPRKVVLKNFLLRLDEAYRNRWIPEKVFKAGKLWQADLNGIESDEEFYSRVMPFIEEYMTDASNSETWGYERRKLSSGGHKERGGYRSLGLQMNFLIANGIEFQEGDITDITAKFNEHIAEAFDWFNSEAGVTFGFIDGFALTRAEKEAEELYFRVQGKSKQDFTENAYQSKVLNHLKEAEHLHEGVLKNVTFAPDRYHVQPSEIPKSRRQRKKLREEKERTLSMQEFTAARMRDIRGQSFYHLFLKDPLCFLNNFRQFSPEIARGIVQIPAYGGNEPKMVPASEYYFGTDAEGKPLHKVPPNLNDERKRVITFLSSRFLPNEDREQLSAMLTEGKKFQELPNMNELMALMDFYSDLQGEYIFDLVEEERIRLKVEENKTDEEISAFQNNLEARFIQEAYEKMNEDLYHFLTLAHSRAYDRKKPRENSIDLPRDRIVADDVFSYYDNLNFQKIIDSRDENGPTIEEKKEAARRQRAARRLRNALFGDSITEREDVLRKVLSISEDDIKPENLEEFREEKRKAQDELNRGDSYQREDERNKKIITNYLSLRTKFENEKDQAIKQSLYLQLTQLEQEFLQAQANYKNTEQIRIERQGRSKDRSINSMGLVNYFNDLVVRSEREYFGDGVGRTSSQIDEYGKEYKRFDGILGEENGFFQMFAKSWYEIEFKRMPNGDQKEHFFYNNAEIAGENAIARTYGDMAVIREIQGKVFKLNSAVRKDGLKGHIEEIKAIVELAKELDPVYGRDMVVWLTTRLLNNIFKTFKEHWATRIPLLGGILRMTMIDKVAISRMRLKTPHALTLTSDDMRGIMHEFQSLSQLYTHQMHELEQIMGIDNSQFWIAGFWPNYILSLLGALLITSLEEAAKKEELIKS